MELGSGEYEFTCYECDGDGSVQVIRGTEDDEPELVSDRCDGCCGEGIVGYDDEEAAEAIELGLTPLRTPSAT